MIRTLPCLVLWGLPLLAVLGVSRTDTADMKPNSATLWHLPTGALQPQAVVDRKGVVHLLYFQGANAGGAGNLYYVRLAPGATRPSEPLRINSEENSAGCVGTVRTAQIALGKEERVHVVWNGLGPKNARGYPEAYQAYTHLNEAGTAFEPQRNLITWAKGVDGGGSVTADTEGNVYVTWHAMANASDEAGRGVFLARSHDNGKTFIREKAANPEPTGACACCGMRAFVDGKGVLYILYRAAMDGVNRDTMLLVSRDKGETFTLKRLHPWRLNACPMSTYSLAIGENGLLAAWETSGQIYYGTIYASGTSLSSPMPVGGSDQKHPVVASASNGQVLLAWTEGTGWQRGGSLGWQVRDKTGKLMMSDKKVGAIPVWGLPSAYARPDGTFVIVY